MKRAARFEETAKLLERKARESAQHEPETDETAKDEAAKRE